MPRGMGPLIRSRKGHLYVYAAPLLVEERKGVIFEFSVNIQSNIEWITSFPPPTRNLRVFAGCVNFEKST